ncbi:hypothetical protein FNF27_02955 [Cafeteria roenbergensis]|uniref:Aspartoacylase n=1 Tax=Cafeteria roenbergensis TaxID=33653 RepID=A0A5A8ECI8_CAFRO|nr:hypothetical protein FNF29_02111 [Cafeteria roenbergensis]KAA0175545.1 hypothetical protein FNF27_02955 [Cafeteria roenbergensis]|eukprot:KAA0154967.1 hypothetical protein FNF29_02111 [Cafeteria roenbergensis]
MASATAAAGAGASPVRLRPFKRVAVVGGTHGNETTGVYALRRFQKHPELLARDGIDVEYCLANPKAVREVRRFVDDDLNRQYSMARLRDDSLESYESVRAKLIEQRFGPKDSDRPHADFLVDMHTTTSRMGITMIFESQGVDPAALYVAKEVRRMLAGRTSAPVFILFADLERDGIPHTPSIARSGVAIEVGPVAQGLLRSDACEWMEQAALAVMDAIARLNTGEATASEAEAVPVFQNSRVKVPCPAGEDGSPLAVFHERLQDGDYRPLRKGDPIFRGLDGEVIEYDGRLGDTVFPVFVNEAAYYLPESGLGFALCHHATLPLPPIVTAEDGAARLSLPVPPADDAEAVAAAIEASDPWEAAKAAAATA